MPAARPDHVTRSKLSFMHWPVEWLWVAVIVAVAVLVFVGLSLGTGPSLPDHGTAPPSTPVGTAGSV